MIEGYLHNAIRSLWPDADISVVDIALAPAERAEFGDVATPVAFRLAKMTGTSPREIAAMIVEHLSNNKPAELDRIEIAGAGYINLFYSKEYLESRLAYILSHADSYGSGANNGKRVIVEYPSTNVAKAMHVGLSRTSFIGDSLARLYAFAGYQVIRWDYIGDWGTGFGKVIAAYKKWGSRSELEATPVDTMLALYVRFTAAAKEDPKLEDEARSEFAKLEQGDTENRELWKWFREETLKESQRLYDLIGLQPFHVSIGEAFFADESKKFVSEMLEKGIATRSEGAVIVKFPDDVPPVAMLEKSDGSTLYLTRDIPNLQYRLREYQPDKILYVVANEQALHFEQLFAIAKMLGLDSAKLEHVKFGLIVGADHKKLSSRTGGSVLFKDVVEEAITRARDIIAQKNPTLGGEEKERVARAIGIGALKYNDLKEYRTGDIVFDWNRVLDFSGNSGPYLQYTFARTNSILTKGDFYSEDAAFEISNIYERTITVHLLRLQEVVDRCLSDNAPHHLALYLYELANHINAFYEHVRVLDDADQAARSARLTILKIASLVLARGLHLLGIDVVERM